MSEAAGGEDGELPAGHERWRQELTRVIRRDPRARSRRRVQRGRRRMLAVVAFHQGLTKYSRLTEFAAARVRGHAAQAPGAGAASSSPSAL